MAEDVIELLDYLGWTKDRDLNVVGTSLGGMIATGAFAYNVNETATLLRLPELAYRIPQRIASLVLAVTTPGGYPWNNLPPIYGMLSLARLTFTPEIEKRVPTVMPIVFTVKWLSEKAEGDARGRTNYQIESEVSQRQSQANRPCNSPTSVPTGIHPSHHHCSQTVSNGPLFTNGCWPNAPRPTGATVAHFRADTQDNDRDWRRGPPRAHKQLVSAQGRHARGGACPVSRDGAWDPRST